MQMLEKPMADEQYPLYIQTLLKPEAYPHPVESVQLVQTHISFVLLAGEMVYKFKKPVNFGFLDFSTLEKRKQCCEQELLLNRRLCPDIYLGLVEINEGTGGLALEGKGEAIEYGVKMKRMPEEQMMVQIIERDELSADHIDALVEVMVPFYEQAERNDEIDSFGTAESVAVNVLENFEQTATFIGGDALSQEQFDAISSYARSVLAQENLFQSRIDQGLIRDCHGDLYSANICLADKVYIYDCIEFNRRFRYCDVASDVAFLAMDMDFHGLDQLSRQFIDRFCEQSGDDDLRKMLNFYTCYRAYVRGKIGLFTAGDPAVDPAVKEKSLTAAAKYFTLAHHYAKQG
jgi:aminoglycoside phosphotransferase family enzyme